MVEIICGDLIKSDADALVNPVNCDCSISQRGIASRFRREFGENFAAYRRASAMNVIRLGRVFVFRTPYIFGPRYIINFPIRDGKWKTRIQDIEVGLRDLVNQVNRLGIQSIAMPPLGCETKVLHWVDVRVRIEKVFGPLREVRTLLFAPVQTFGTIPCGSEVNESEPCP